MKLKKIIVAGLCILLIFATLMSIASIVSISNELIDDNNKNGTSKDPTSSSGNTGEPEAPEEFENYIEGSIVRTATAYTGTVSGYYKINSGRAFAYESNGIIYCGIKYEIPEDMEDLYMSYCDLTYDVNNSTVFRYSMDLNRWYLLDEDIYNYSGDRKYAEVCNSNFKTVYMSFYVLSASDRSLDSALEQFESFASESLNIYISNSSSGGVSN